MLKQLNMLLKSLRGICWVICAFFLKGKKNLNKRHHLNFLNKKNMFTPDLDAMYIT